MANIFPRWVNQVPMFVVLGVPAGIIFAACVVTYWFSPEFTDVGYQPDQPVPFSHKLHAGDLEMDCRYCHNTVERGARAAVPPAETCMNCHSMVKTDSEALAPIRKAVETGEPVVWNRVHLLPDFAYFDHSVHLGAGVGCSSCHGRIDQMEKVTQAEPLSMGWCLECHRNPEPNLRPKGEITNMAWNQLRAGYDPHKDADRSRMPNPPEHCSGCHR